MQLIFIKVQQTLNVPNGRDCNCTLTIVRVIYF